jgi:hypothetical protein
MIRAAGDGLRPFPLLVLALTALLSTAGVEVAGAQGGPRPAARALRPADRAAARADVVRAAREAMASLERLLAVDEQELDALTVQHEQWERAYADGRATQEQLEASQRELDVAAVRVAQTRRMVVQSSQALAEVAVAVRHGRRRPLPRGELESTATLVRFDGSRAWSLEGAPGIARFFQERFARPLPVSAMGQTSAHDRLALDHRHGLDIAVHPDSAEGQALMAHLRAHGIAFLAYRRAVDGAATGAHIHIGPPSQRVVR